jgi:hypothetical protein
VVQRWGCFFGVVVAEYFVWLRFSKCVVDRWRISYLTWEYIKYVQGMTDLNFWRTCAGRTSVLCFVMFFSHDFFLFSLELICSTSVLLTELLQTHLWVDNTHTSQIILHTSQIPHNTKKPKNTPKQHIIINQKNHAQGHQT